MATNLTEAQISAIVAKVVSEYKKPATVSSGKPWDSTQYEGRRLIGVYATMEEAIDAANEGYKLVRAMSVAQREKVITSIREFTRKEAPIMAALGVAETKMGKVEHQTAKHLLVADKTPGTEDITPTVRTGDDGLTLTEQAPFGVVGAITPPNGHILLNKFLQNNRLNRQKRAIAADPLCDWRAIFLSSPFNH